VLGDPQEAEDAFQATFLVLVQKAGGIRKKESLGHWLVGVARRIAVRARARSRRRGTIERNSIDSSLGLAEQGTIPTEVAPVLREEVALLPELYRLPVVLCYLEGMTNEEAASRMNCASGTLKWRLARAKEILRERLSRRGVATTAGTLLMLPVPEEAVMDRLVKSTVEAAVCVANQGSLRPGLISERVALMAKDAMRRMFFAELVTATVALFTLTVAITASVVLLTGSFPKGGWASMTPWVGGSPDRAGGGHCR
jgi:RNA polymerase sigma factor (sigma-70 family)